MRAWISFCCWAGYRNDLISIHDSVVLSSMKSKPPIILVASLLLVVSLIVFARRATADLYVSDFGAGQIYRYSPDGVGHIFASVPDAKGLAFDAANNLYAASYSKRTIFKIRPNGQKSIFASSQAIPLILPRLPSTAQATFLFPTAATKAGSQRSRRTGPSFRLWRIFVPMHLPSTLRAICSLQTSTTTQS